MLDSGQGQYLSLINLPNEIKAHVLSYLMQNKLAAVASVSQHFNDIIKPLLYPSMSLDLQHPAIYVHSAIFSHGPMKRFHGLIAKFSKNSVLASRVKTLSLKLCDSNFGRRSGKGILEFLPSLKRFYLCPGPTESRKMLYRTNITTSLDLNSQCRYIDAGVPFLVLAQLFFKSPI